MLIAYSLLGCSFSIAQLPMTGQESQPVQVLEMLKQLELSQLVEVKVKTQRHPSNLDACQQEAGESPSTESETVTCQLPIESAFKHSSMR
ncbi:hypothetical protein [Thioflexithrix psekupsensis]|nr:hypothetical protein [Thioflexithrix psekupsensis]